MFTPGSILHGIFHLKAITKPKYAIVLYNDGINCILTIFTPLRKDLVLYPLYMVKIRKIANRFLMCSRKELSLENYPIRGQLFLFPFPKIRL